MSLQIGSALKNGLTQIASRTGATLVLAYLVLFAVYQFAFNGLMQAVYTDLGFEEAAAGLEPALGASMAVSGAIVGVCTLLMTYLTVVAVRTFVAGERDSIPGEFLTDNVVFAVVNLFVGGLVLSVLLTVGFFLLVIPGLVLMVALMFMTMYVAAENENFVAAMGESWRLTEGERLSLFGLYLVVLVLAFALGLVFAVLALVAALAGIGSFVSALVTTVVVAPFTMYNLAVISDAFNQLRAADSGDSGARTTAGDTPASTV